MLFCLLNGAAILFVQTSLEDRFTYTIFIKVGKINGGFLNFYVNLQCSSNSIHLLADEHVNAQVFG